MRGRALIGLAAILTIGSVTALAGEQEPNGADPACHVGTTKQLFLDDYVVDGMAGLDKVLHQAKRHLSNPILVPEHPWEGDRLILYGSVVYHETEKLFKIWHCGYAEGKGGLYQRIFHRGHGIRTERIGFDIAK